MGFSGGRLGSLICALGVSLAVLSGCGKDEPVSAKLSEYTIQLSSATAKAGDVTFKIANAGTVVHELVVVQTDQGVDALPKNAEGVVDEEQLISMGEQGDLEVGKATDLTLKLPAGHYMLICNLPGHFAGGMHADFTVTN
jgi:uncharacterized cupredoxin-like copper-binding protein